MKRIFLITALLLFTLGCSSKKMYKEDNFLDGKFKNTYLDYNHDFSKFLKISWDFVFHKSEKSIPTKKIPIVQLTQEDILNMQDYSVVRLSHSSLLFKIDNKLILTDPVFSNRVSPFSFIGPKRLHPNPIEIKDLPNIDVVLISHNHYDHLDEMSISQLKEKTNKFLVPLNVSKHLLEFGVDKDKIEELNWWDNQELGSLNFIAAPAQHFSGRGIFDKDESLWVSWVIKSQKESFYFTEKLFEMIKK